MTFVLGANSLKRLEGVHPTLVAVVKRAIQITPQDFSVVQGVRTRDEMCVNYGKGRTAAQCAAKGVPAKFAAPDLAKVTWLNDPFKSKHGVAADGFGHAVDLAAFVDGKIDWDDLDRFKVISEAMKAAARGLDASVTWGGDWTSSKDFPHYELNPPRTTL